MRTLAVDGLPISTSGAAYRNVPCALEAEEKWSVMVASPTSAIFAALPLVSRMLLVLTSLHHGTPPKILTNKGTLGKCSGSFQKLGERCSSMTVSQCWAAQELVMRCASERAAYLPRRTSKQ